MIQHTVTDYVSLFVSIAMLLFISLTMLLRGNDYRRKHTLTWIGVVRMTGFTLSGFAPFGVIGWWLLTGMWPSAFMAALLTGVSCVFFTSPNVPPWADLLTKGSPGL